jgi:hypothetical protein
MDIPEKSSSCKDKNGVFLNEIKSVTVVKYTCKCGNEKNKSHSRYKGL